MPASKMPSTLKRSPKKAQDIYEKTFELPSKSIPATKSALIVPLTHR
jgi:hypothetical protein